MDGESDHSRVPGWDEHMGGTRDWDCGELGRFAITYLLDLGC
jgi:hypothetical protein